MTEEIVNPFPSPPSHYRLYTQHNLNLLDLLRTRTSTNDHDPISPEKQQQTLSDQDQVPPWDLTTLEKPRADWIIEQGGYETFGDFWPVRAARSNICRQLHSLVLIFPRYLNATQHLRKGGFSSCISKATVCDALFWYSHILMNN